jgi:Tc toxin complex TcA C-terminal TcB-binding domain
VYFQSYQLAYDLAKRAERCFRFELGLQDSSYIQFGYWDSLKKGLLSGEKLQYDLHRLENAYMEQNRREFELTKSISLLLLDPLALVKLRETGRCFISLPEEIFDLDYPGHYFRRIKSVSLTLPCVVGPYTTISCTLRLLKNSIRVNTVDANTADKYPRYTDDQGLPVDDDRFTENNIPVNAIAASSAQNDSGVFELSFRDERYLPFEGGGAISDWSLELFNDNDPDFGKPLRQFDYSTISDAILHVKYTAREDAGAFKNGAVAHLRDYFSHEGTTHSLRLFNLRQEFSTQWHRFLNPANPADGNIFELEMSPNLFPARDAEKTLKINTIWLIARCTNTGSYNVVISNTSPAGSVALSVTPTIKFGGLHINGENGTDVSTPGILITPTDPPAKWKITMTSPLGVNLQAAEVKDMFLVLGYKWE